MLIGIDEYQDPWIPNLAGARNDVCAWWRFLVERLDVPGGDITVLHGGALTEADLAGPRRIGEPAAVHAQRLAATGPTTLLEATADRVRAALKALRAELDADARLLIVFSGHGTSSPHRNELDRLAGSPALLDELALVLPEAVPDGDAVSPGAVGTVRLSELRAAAASLTDGLQASNVTIVVDACFGRPTLGDLQWSRSIGTLALPDLELGRATGGDGVAIHACATDEITHEVVLDGIHRGAFTAGLLFSTDLWSTADQGGGGRYVRATVGELVRRAQGHTALWGSRQHPVVSGTDARVRPFLLGSSATSTPSTSKAPDRGRGGRQIIVEDLRGSGGYEFDLGGNDLVRALATWSVGTLTIGSLRVESNREYWKLRSSAVGALETLLQGAGPADITIRRFKNAHTGGAGWVRQQMLTGGTVHKLKRTSGLGWKDVSTLSKPLQDQILSTDSSQRRAVFTWRDYGRVLRGPYRRAIQLRWNGTGDLTAVYFLTDEPLAGVGAFGVSFFKHFVQNPGSTLNANLLLDGASLPAAKHTWWVSRQRLTAP